MKILIPTIGSRGDIQPYIALGSGLQKAGYDVTFATHPTFRSLVEFHGLKFAPFGPDIDLGVDTAKLRENKHALDGNFIKVFDKDGNFLANLSGEGSEPGQVDKPQGIAIDLVRGYLIVSEENNNRVQVLNLADLK